MATYSIAQTQAFKTNLDEVYKLGLLSADLEGDNADIKEGANAHEFKIPKLTLGGLYDYSRNNGYTKGNITLAYESVALNYERGTKLGLDILDEAETGLGFSKVAAEFVRTAVVPEKDAFVFAEIASKSGIGSATGTLSSGADAVSAIRTGITAVENGEAVINNCILYITPTLMGLIDDLDTTKSRATINSFKKVVKVPQSRFYSVVTLGSGSYSKASTGVDINFLIVDPSAVVDYTSFYWGKIINPEDNQESDQYLMKFRVGSYVEVYDNKVAGIYCHKKAAAA